MFYTYVVEPATLVSRSAVGSLTGTTYMGFKKFLHVTKIKNYYSNNTNNNILCAVVPLLHQLILLLDACVSLVVTMLQPSRAKQVICGQCTFFQFLLTPSTGQYKNRIILQCILMVQDDE